MSQILDSLRTIVTGKEALRAQQTTLHDAQVRLMDNQSDLTESLDDLSERLLGVEADIVVTSPGPDRLAKAVTPGSESPFPLRTSCFPDQSLQHREELGFRPDPKRIELWIRHILYSISVSVINDTPFSSPTRSGYSFY